MFLKDSYNGDAEWSRQESEIRRATVSWPSPGHGIPHFGIQGKFVPNSLSIAAMYHIPNGSIESLLWEFVLYADTLTG